MFGSEIPVETWSEMLQYVIALRRVLTWKYSRVNDLGE